MKVEKRPRILLHLDVTSQECMGPNVAEKDSLLNQWKPTNTLPIRKSPHFVRISCELFDF